MHFPERQVNIINRIMRASEPINVKDLALAEDVSLQTIYNDLKVIENIGVSINRGSVGITVDENEKSVIKQKITSNKALREKACDYVIDTILAGNPQGLIFIDGGSTGYLFFQSLQKRRIRDLIIISSNPLIIGSVEHDEEFFYQNSIFVTGGKLDPMRMSLYSIAWKSDFIPIKGENNLIDTCILGIRAISSKGDLFIDNEEEVPQKKTLISKSRKLIIIVSSDKLGSTGLFKIASLPKEIRSKQKSIHIIITEDSHLNTIASVTVRKLTDLLGKLAINIVK